MCRIACARSGREIGRWLAEGAHFYVCGDAKRMAKDVERALVDIAAQYGARDATKRSPSSPVEEVGPLSAGRLLRNAMLDNSPAPRSAAPGTRGQAGA